MNIIFFENLFKNLDEREVFSLFNCASIEELDFFPILQDLGNSNLKLLHENHLSYPNNYFKIEMKYKNYFQILKTCKFEGFKTLFFDVTSMFHNYILIVPNVKKTKIFIFSFNDIELLKGFELFYSVLNKYPEELIIFHNSKEIYLNFDLSIKFQNDNIPLEILYIKFKGKNVKFDSQNIFGWNKLELFDLIKQKFGVTTIYLKSLNNSLFELLDDV